MMEERIVVFGGTGFIGTPLVAALLAEGHHVRVLSRRRIRSDHPRLEFVPGALGDPDALAAVIRGADMVYHLATGGGSTWSDFQRDVVEATERIARACLEQNVRRLVYTSSIAALNLGGGATVDESAGIDSRPERRGVYSRAKILAERRLWQMHEREGLPVVILRPGVVLGDGGVLAHAGFGTWASDVCCVGWGRGRNPLPLVLVDDVVRALCLARTAPGVDGAAFNLAGDVRLTAREAVQVIADHSRRHYRFYPQSLAWAQAVDVVKWLVKVAARKPENSFPSFRDLRSNSLRAPLDCSEARERLGWQPVASRDEFIARAFLPHIAPLEPGDLRLDR